MERKHRAGIATFVMRERAYLAAIFARGGLLRLETLRFADELRDLGRIGLPTKHGPDPKRVSAFAREIEKLAKQTRASEELADATALRLRELALRKHGHGQDVVEIPLPDSLGGQAEVIDMMEILKQSLKAAAPTRRETSGRRPRHKAHELTRRARPTRERGSGQRRVAGSQRAGRL